MLLCWLLRSPTKHTLKHCWLLFGSLLNWMLWPTECNHWGRFRMIKCTSHYQYFHTIGTSLTLLWEFTFGKESMPISIFFTKQMEKKIFKLKAVQLIFCNDFKCCLMNSFCLLDIRSCVNWGTDLFIISEKATISWKKLLRMICLIFHWFISLCTSRLWHI